MKRCAEHGAVVKENGDCATIDVLVAVGMERNRQFKLHGNNLENKSGTGPNATWAAPLAGFTGAGAKRLESALRRKYETKHKFDVTWLDILLEEFSEVAQEDNPVELFNELVQVAAVAVSWAEKLLDPESEAK